MDMNNIFKGVSFEIEPQGYVTKGRYSVDIYFQFSDRINKGNQFLDRRRYNTEQEREIYIAQSIKSYSLLAQKYHTNIRALKVDGRYWNTSRIANICDELNEQKKNN